MKQSISTNRSPHSVRSIFSPLERGQGVCKCPPINHLFLLLLLLLASCTETDVVDDKRPAAGQEVEASFNLQVLASQSPQTRSITFTAEGAIESDSLAVDIAAAAIPAAPDSLQTKSVTPLTEVQESKLSSLWVGQYDASTGARLFSQYFSTLSGNTVDIKLIVNTAGQTSHVYFVANTSDLGTVADEATLKARTLPFSSTEAGLPNNSLCMMMGTWSGAIPSGGVNNITVQLRRLVAKISFTYAIGGSGFSFTLDSVSLRNAPALSQVSAPTTQLTAAGMSYKDYTDKNPDPTSKTFYWYLPENMAGTVSGANVVTSEKQKVGTGVTNATCIELAGSAVQDGVTYNNVVIRFFPGNGVNNYDIVRNANYQMNVTLVGLDASDERITVGEIPPVVVDPAKMLAEKGSEKTVQIPARPGVAWVLNLPPWLSALVDGTTAPAGSTITYDGPVLVTLQTATANPKAEDRTETVNLSIDNTPQPFELTQAGSELTLNNNISLDVSGITESSATFTATKGLPWIAVPSAGWIVFTPNNPATEGEATGELQTLKVKADGVNQYAESREGRIILKAGASITDATYMGLKKERAVVQMGSKVTDCTVLNNTAAEGVPSMSGSFAATPGLDWRSSVGTDTWLHVTGGGSGTPTTGSPQTVTFSVDVNPNSTLRSGGITVEAGLPAFGPKGKIVVSQDGSTFDLLSSSTVELGSDGTTFNAIIKGTQGLRWEVNPHDAAKQIAPILFNGDVTGQEQNIEFAARENVGPPRTETFNITVPGGDHKRTVTVRQMANPILTINQEILTNYVAKIGVSLSSYPPFDIDGDKGQWIKDKHPGVEFTLGAPTTMTGYYQLQVQSTQPGTYVYQSGSSYPAREYCKNLREGGFTDWRLPTQIELYIMWDKAKGTNANASDNEPDSKIYGAPFTASWYWSSSVYNGTTGRRCVLYFGSGSFGSGSTTLNYSVRCVRDKN